MSVNRIGTLIYVGYYEPFLAETSEISRNFYGVDEFTRKFICPKHKVKDFLLKYPAETKDHGGDFGPNSSSVPVFPSFSVEKIGSVSIERAWATVMMQFVGRLDDGDSQVKIEDEYYNATIQGQTTGGQLFLDYRGTQTTYTYAVKARPIGPKYKPSIGTIAPEGAIVITEKRGVLRLGGTDFENAAAGVQPVCRLKPPYTRRQRGLWWECEETWEWALEQKAEFFAPGVILIS